MSGPVAEIVCALVRTMSASETAVWISDTQRSVILQSAITAYYSAMVDKEVIFDTSRQWCSLASTVGALFPEARIICMVRNPAWIIDSFERIVQTNALQAPRMFGYNPHSNVYLRAEAVAGKDGVLGASLHGLRQAWFGESACRLIAIRYESLAKRPAEVIHALYQVLGEKLFAHEFDHVEYDASEFDERRGMPGLHRVSGRVEVKERETILPSDLFVQASEHCFWNKSDENPRGVIIL